MSVPFICNMTIMGIVLIVFIVAVVKAYKEDKAREKKRNKVPEIGGMYCRDPSEDLSDPFKRAELKPIDLCKVLDVKEGYVQFVYDASPDRPHSHKISTFNCCYIPLERFKELTA